MLFWRQSHKKAITRGRKMRHATTISSPLSISPFDSFRLGLRAKSVTSSVNPKLSNPPTPRAAFSVTEQQNDASQYAPLWPDSFKTCDAVRASRDTMWAHENNLSRSDQEFCSVMMTLIAIRDREEKRGGRGNDSFGENASFLSNSNVYTEISHGLICQFPSISTAINCRPQPH